MSQNIPDQFFQKLKNNQQTPEEHHAFIQWLDEASPEEVERVLKQFSDHFEQLPSTPFTKNETLFSLIEDRIDQAEQRKERQGKPLKRFLVNSWFKRVAAAACFVGAIWLVLPTKNNPAFQFASNKKNISPIVPGGDKAVLVLADGRSIILDSATNGTIAMENQVSINKTAKGELQYAVANANHAIANHKNSNGDNSANIYNSINTPRGGEYRIVLSDGTKVWLNAQSSLRFPTQFAGNSRFVELTGEAYFEVAKDKSRPFKVSVNNTSVEVLGTHFNVMGYQDEGPVKTSLLEGSVRVSNGTQARLIKPGEQALAGTSIAVAAVNVNEAVEWKNKNFNFAHEKIETIMRKIARWYDITVEYKGKTTGASFVGTIPRSQSIGEVLKYLEMTGVVRFKVKERRVTVMP